MLHIVGSGKTSLVNSIVQTCDHIVHVDPFPSAAASRPPRREYLPSQLFSNPNAAVREIYASTKPYPSWWSDLEESRLLRRRKSSVLERNICFVDTPPSNTSPIDQTVAIIQYMHQQLIRSTTALNTPNVDLQNMLAGNGGSQVDAVLYLISEGMFVLYICSRSTRLLTSIQIHSQRIFNAFKNFAIGLTLSPLYPNQIFCRLAGLTP